MELRKVQLTGGSSLTVTLPKRWIDRVELKPGDVVGCLEQPDGSLSVHPHAKGERSPQRYRIEYGGGGTTELFRQVVGAYLMGYEIITIRAKAPLSTTARTAIRKAVQRIMGLEIVEEEPTLITIQDFLDPKEFHMEKALRRMGLLTQALQEEALSGLLTPRADAAASVEDRDDEVDKLYWLVNKQFHAMLRDVSYAERMGLTSSQALNFLLVARLVERTADHADRVAVNAAQIERTKPIEDFLKQIEKEGRQAVRFFQDSIKAFLQGDGEKANQLIDQVIQFNHAAEKLVRKAVTLPGEAISHAIFVLESIRRTAAYAADVSEVAINHRIALGHADAKAEKEKPLLAR